MLDGLDFVALAVKHEQLAHELWFYKDGPSPFDRRRMTLGLAAVLWRWLREHEACVARKCGVEGFPLVTTVPSTNGRLEHPLVEIVGSIIEPTRDRYRQTLTTAPTSNTTRTFSCDRFSVDDSQSGGPVLLIDDTFTTGSRVQSAACALKKAGYGPIGAVVIGRHFSMEQGGEFGQAAKNYYSMSKKLGWDWRRCCLGDDRDPVAPEGSHDDAAG
jgi:hypothetical protein